MLRPVTADRIGTTDFFRNPAFLNTLVELLKPIRNPRVIFHACSNGAEPYSFAVTWLEAGGGPITIEATDIEPTFLDEAEALSHPRLTDEARALVTFLPASSVTTFTTHKVYDAVICMNALCYLSKDEQRRAFWKMASVCERYLCVTAADPLETRHGIREARFQPVFKNWVAIYYGWKERLSLRHRKVWKLPYVPLMLPWVYYTGTSIFERRPA
jgi:chemotaxis methyl-accepting protein methylase